MCLKTRLEQLQRHVDSREPIEQFVYDDGGRVAAGYRGDANDCAVRAIAIATRLPYQQVYNEINQLASRERITRRSRKRSSACNGVRKATTRTYLERLGWHFVATMGIGTGCKTHLKAEELPHGRLIVQVSRHIVAVIDGVIRDTHDPSRGGTRCVYGYWIEE